MFSSWFDSEAKQGGKLWTELLRLHDELYQNHDAHEVLNVDDFKTSSGKWDLEKLENAVQLNFKRHLGEKLVDAAANGDVKKVRKLLKMKDIDIDYQNQEESATALMKVCEMSFNEEVRGTPEKAVEIARLLLGHNPPPDLNIQDEAGWTALMVASAQSRYDAKLVRMLLKFKPPPNVNLFSITGWTACMLAAREGNSEVLESILNYANPDPNLQSNDGMTAVMLAAQNVSNRVVQRMLNHGIAPDLSMQDDHGRTVFDYAVLRVDKRSDNRVIYSLRNRFFFPEPSKTISFSSLTSVTEVSRGIFATTYWGALVIGETKRWNRGVKVTLPVFCKVPTVENIDEYHELQTLKNLPHHPNVHYLLAMCNDFQHKEDTVSAMVLLYKEGGALRAHLDHRKEPLSFGRLVEFGFRMVYGLRHIHNHGFKHNDVAARNFLLTEKEDDKWGSDLQQYVVLSEFWLSRPMDYKSDTEETILPWRWASPETLISFGHITSKSTDVWMLGISLWELLAVKECPYHWLNNPDKIVQTAREQGHAPLIFPTWTRNSWKDLILRCCSFESKDRPSTETLKQELTRMQESLIVTKEEEPKPRPLAEFELERQQVREREQKAAMAGRKLEQKDDNPEKEESASVPKRELSSSNLMHFEIEYQRHKQRNRKNQSVMMNAFQHQLTNNIDKQDEVTYFDDREEFDDVFEWGDGTHVDFKGLLTEESGDPQFSGIYYKVPEEESKMFQQQLNNNIKEIHSNTDYNSERATFERLELQLHQAKDRICLDETSDNNVG